MYGIKPSLIAEINRWIMQYYKNYVVNNFLNHSENEGEYCEVCGIHYDEEDPCPFH